MQQISKVTSVLGFAMLGLVSSAAADSSDPIKIAVNEWTGQHVSAHISGSVLQAAGYTVEYVTAGAVPQFAAIAQEIYICSPKHGAITWETFTPILLPMVISWSWAQQALSQRKAGCTRAT